MNNIEKYFDELIPLDSSLLEQLNKSIEGTIREKQRFYINYDMLENILATIVKNQRFKRIGPVNKVVPIKKEELLSVALSFFKSIDDELYAKARDTILGQLQRVKMNMYLVHNVKDFSAKDENGIKEYTRDASVQTDKGFSVVHIPLQERLSSKEAKVILQQDEGTLGDLYTIVHEISHLFDLDQIDTTLTKEEIATGKRYFSRKTFTRELLGEATTIAFEGLLTDYLLANSSYPKSAIKEIANIRANNSLGDAQITYAKLVLAREKEKKGEITLEFIEEMMKQNNMSVQDIRRTAKKVISDDKGVFYRNRYAVGGLVAPTIIKSYENDRKTGTQSLKTYLKAVYDDNLEAALKAIGIELNDQGLSTLIKNYKVRDTKINEDRER